MGGFISNTTQQQQTSSVDSNLSAAGQQDRTASNTALSDYQNLANSQNTYTQNAPNQYAQMLQNYSQGGFLPNQTQIGAANQYAQQQFAPQQAALNNTFTQAGIDNNRQAASLGRSVNDPILAAKLAQYQGQQQQVLSGQQTAMGSQVAMGMPQQQLGFAQQLSNQAFANKQNIFNLGQTALTNEQNWALANANRTTSGQGSATPNPLSMIMSLGGVAAIAGASPGSGAPSTQNPSGLGMPGSGGGGGGSAYSAPPGYDYYAPSQSTMPQISSPTFGGPQANTGFGSAMGGQGSLFSMGGAGSGGGLIDSGVTGLATDVALA